MHKFHRLSSLLMATLLGAACFAGPDRPQPRTRIPPPQISFIPFVGQDRAAPAMRILLQPAPDEEPVLVLGKLSNRELKDLQEGRESSALQERRVPVVSWLRGDSLELAPQTWIEPGEVLTIGAPAAGWTHAFSIDEPDAVPRLQRVWPPPGLPSSGSFAVWCLGVPATGEVYSADSMLDLEPGAVRGRLRTGSLEGIGRDCVSWEALQPPSDALMPPPTALLDDGRMARVDPTPIVPSIVEEAPRPTSCGKGRVPVGPACARVMDDRAEVSVDSGVWWVAFRTGTERWASTLSPQAPVIWRGLHPAREHVWEAYSIDLSGERRAWHGSFRTEPPMAHVVINEVMANPSGAEPDQEWVELYNDGAVGVDLEGWTIEDPGGVAALPSGWLRPGGFALVVNEGYLPNSWPDPTPAEGALILRVAKLGNQGLSNGGEPLQLKDDAGRVRSGVLPRASPKAGHSIARTAPDAVDWLEGSFVSSSSSTPAAPNKL